MDLTLLYSHEDREFPHNHIIEHTPAVTFPSSYKRNKKAIEGNSHFGYNRTVSGSYITPLVCMALIGYYYSVLTCG